MDKTYNLQEANSVVPLLTSIAREVEERRSELRQLRRDLRNLSSASTPEGLDSSIADLEIRLRECEAGFRESLAEVEELGGHVLRLQPLTVHLNGRTKTGKVVFCWQVGETGIHHGHRCGEEHDARRPLHLRLTNGQPSESGDGQTREAG
ncbi:MAG: DUF2203 family protein [Planctomycetota bacterium]